jgi:hypothetical protein
MYSKSNKEFDNFEIMSSDASKQLHQFIRQQSGRINFKQFNSKMQQIANELKEIVLLMDGRYEDMWTYIPDETVIPSPSEIDALKLEFVGANDDDATAADVQAYFADRQQDFDSAAQDSSIRIYCTKMKINLGACDSIAETRLLEQRIPSAFTTIHHSPFRPPQTDDDRKTNKFLLTMVLNNKFNLPANLLNWQYARLPWREQRLIKRADWCSAVETLDRQSEHRATIFFALLVWGGPAMFMQVN